MKRALKWLVGIAVAVVLLAIVAAIALPYLVDTPRVQAMIASNASQAVGRPVKFVSLSVALFPLPAVELHKLEIADDPQFGTAPFLTLETGRIRVKLRPLLTGRVEFGDITLERPLIAIIQSADGRLNVASLGATGEPKVAARPGRPAGGAGGTIAAVAAQVSIKRGAATYVAHGKEGATPYRVEDLDLTLTGQGMQLNFKGALRVVPGDLVVKLANGVVALNGAKAVSEAPVRARVTIEGKDISRLVAAAAAGPSPAISGPITGAFTLGGTVGAPRVSGDVELSSPSVTQTNAACPDPKQRVLSLGALKVAGASYNGGRFQSRPVTTSIGKGTISLNAGATLERGVRVQLGELRLKEVPIERVLVDFLCQGYAVAGPLDLTGAVGFSASDVFNTLDGAGDLRIGPGKVVGAQALALIGSVVRIGGAVSSLLAADLPSTLFASPVDFDSITGTWKITNGVLATRDLLYTSRAMKIAVAGEYGLATGRVNADMRVIHGRGEVRAKVTGNAASPSVRVDPSSVVGEGGRQKVEEGIQDLLKRFKR